jgi:hypothetical protein
MKASTPDNYRRPIWLSAEDHARLAKLKRSYKVDRNSKVVDYAMLAQNLQDIAMLDKPDETPKMRHYKKSIQAIAEGCSEVAKARGILKRKKKENVPLSRDEAAIVRVQLSKINLWFDTSSQALVQALQRRWGMTSLAEVVRFVLRVQVERIN